MMYLVFARVVADVHVVVETVVGFDVQIVRQCKKRSIVVGVVVIHYGELTRDSRELEYSFNSFLVTNDSV